MLADVTLHAFGVNVDSKLWSQHIPLRWAKRAPVVLEDFHYPQTTPRRNGEYIQ